MTNLSSSSEHRQQGLLSPVQRLNYFRAIFFYMNKVEALTEEIDPMQDLCYHLYSQSVAERMAKHLGVSVPKLRKALDIGLKAAEDCDGGAAMTTPSLPYHVPRCRGVGYEEDGTIDWREGCENCLRRTAPPHPDPSRRLWISPPPIIAFFCEHLIEP